MRTLLTVIAILGAVTVAHATPPRQSNDPCSFDQISFPAPPNEDCGVCEMRILGENAECAACCNQRMGRGNALTNCMQACSIDFWDDIADCYQYHPNPAWPECHAQGDDGPACPAHDGSCGTYTAVTPDELQACANYGTERMITALMGGTEPEIAYAEYQQWLTAYCPTELAFAGCDPSHPDCQETVPPCTFNPPAGPYQNQRECRTAGTVGLKFAVSCCNNCHCDPMDVINCISTASAAKDAWIITVCSILPP
jgi:hypothetical protein